MPGSGGEEKQLTLALDATAATPALPELTRWERMLADYRQTGLSVGIHPLELLRPHLPPGTLTSNELLVAPHRGAVSYAGLAVARQRPSTAKGIVFMLLEDEFGQVNLIIPSHIYEQHRALVRGEPLLLVSGRFEHIGENRNIVVSTLETLGSLARAPPNRTSAGLSRRLITSVTADRARHTASEIRPDAASRARTASVPYRRERDA